MGSPEDRGVESAADLAAERVREIVTAAERAAAAIVADAEDEARRIRETAGAEADEIRATARAESNEAASREASGRIEQARGAVEGLVAQADRLRAQVGALGRGLASSAPGSEPDEDAEPEPETGRADDETEAVVEASERVPAGAAAKPQPGSGGATDDVPSNEDLVAQLRGAPAEPDPAGSGSAPAADQGARLVAMNMALDGAPREEIAKQIEVELGPVADVDALIDDVLSRAGR